MGIILIDRVVGMDDGHVQVVGQGIGHPERGKLALRMDHVGMPGDQLPRQTAGAVDPQPGPGIDAVGADGTHIVDAAVLVRMNRGGQRDHPDLVSPGLQLPLEQQHAGYHAVDDRSIPVCCNQNLHMIPSTFIFLERQGLPSPSVRFIITNPLPWGKRFFRI